MAAFDALIKFRCKEDSHPYFAPVAAGEDAKLQIPCQGSVLSAYTSIGDLQMGVNSRERTIDRVCISHDFEQYLTKITESGLKQLLAPLPSTVVPIYCVGLNYRSHATEANLSVPKYPPLWTKPATSLADPDETVPVNEFCALSLLDFEGELVFVTSKDCKDVKPSEAEAYILGYAAGNDLSCRFFQLPGNSGGQFFFAKAFDKFAPIGPVLISPERYRATGTGRRLVTRVNGAVVQNVEIAKDMIFTPAQILSHMSQGTTIPAGTAVMTGTPAGVGAFQSPKSFLKDGDVVEVEIDYFGILKNEIRFENIVWWRRIYLKALDLALWLFT